MMTSENIFGQDPDVRWHVTNEKRMSWGNGRGKGQRGGKSREDERSGGAHGILATTWSTLSLNNSATCSDHYGIRLQKRSTLSLTSWSGRCTLGHCVAGFDTLRHQTIKQFSRQSAICAAKCHWHSHYGSLGRPESGHSKNSGVLHPTILVVVLVTCNHSCSVRTIRTLQLKKVPELQGTL